MYPAHFIKSSKYCAECRRVRELQRNFPDITLEQINAKHCEICNVLLSSTSKNNMRVIDHDHATGKVRGTLCMTCNSMLGYAYDSPETLEAGANYLRHHQAIQVYLRSSSFDF